MTLFRMLFRRNPLSTLLLGLCACFFFSGCTVELDGVHQPVLAGANHTLVGRMDLEIVSGATAESRPGWVAVLLPTDWTVSTSTYYVVPLRHTDSQTTLVATTTLETPSEAPTGYQWYTATTPESEAPFSGQRYAAVINMITGSDLGTYDLVYYAGDPIAGWTSSSTKTVVVQEDPCEENPALTDGDGDGYREIFTFCDLQAIRDNLATDYELMNDIDASDAGNELFVSGGGFEPIGSVATPFSGRFDGHHHTITGLYIYQPEQSGVGLFGSVTGQVTHLRLVDAAITGGNSVGAITGSLNYSGSALEEVSAIGQATGTDMLGGLVGNMLEGTISSSYADVDLSSTDGRYIGGIVGNMTSSRLENVYSTGDILSTSLYVGGLVGNNTTAAPGSILQSYAAGSIVGQEYVGGLVGRNNQDDIAYSFSAAAPVGSLGTPTVGGLVGSEILGGSSFLFTHAYWYPSSIDTARGVGDYEEATSSTRWESVESVDVFKGSPSNAPFTIGGTRRWSSSVWSFPASAYPKLVPFSLFTISYTASAGGRIDGAASQTIRGSETGTPVTAIPDTGYRFTSWSDGGTSASRSEMAVNANANLTANFEPIAQNTGGGGASAAIPPTLLGSGGKNDTSALHLPIGSTLTLGEVPLNGLNVVTYVTNINRFTLLGSLQHFTVTNLDLYHRNAILEFSNSTSTLRLRVQESGFIDLTGDGVSDLRVTFSGIETNRAEFSLFPMLSSVRGADPRPTVPAAQTDRLLFPRILRQGMRGNDVLQLQKFLNLHGCSVARTGPGSAGNETLYFGPSTKAALSAFQRTNGLSPFPGILGDLTRTLIGSFQLKHPSILKKGC